MIINYSEKLPEISKTLVHLAVNSDGTTENMESPIVCEHNLDVYVNEQLLAKLVCTPSNLVELVIGRLISEGIIKNTKDVESIYVCEAGYVAKVFLKDAIKFETAINQIPTCCTDNKILLTKSVSNKLLKKAYWEKQWIFNMANEFVKGSKIHRATNGAHSCYLSVEDKIVFTCEDIGRHNAMDKAIGYADINGFEREKCILFTSGRVPVDMLKKVITAGIPILVSKAVPTKEAVEMSKKYNLTLICKAWPDRFEIFNQAE